MVIKQHTEKVLRLTRLNLFLLKPEGSCSFKTPELCDHLDKQNLLEHEINAKNPKGLTNRETEAPSADIISSD